MNTNTKRTLIILLICIAAVVVIVTAKFYLDAAQGNTLGIYNIQASAVLGGKPGVEIEVYSPRAFPVQDPPPVLQIGDQVFRVVEFKNGDPHTLIFTLTPEEFTNTHDESLITVHYEPDTQGHWDFGFLEKNWTTGQRK
jgi:hypothetical protein